MIWSGSLDLNCSVDTLFWLATHLVTETSGDGDCTIICDNPADLHTQYSNSRRKPKCWEPSPIDQTGFLSFENDQESLSFVSLTDYKDDYGYSWVIHYKGTVCQKSKLLLILTH